LKRSHSIDFGNGFAGPQTDVRLDVGSPHAPWGGKPCTKRALIDTGATATVISPGTRAALNPMTIGRARVNVPSVGIVWADTYFVELSFGGHSGKGRSFALEVIEYQPSTPNVDVLIGMDLLVRIRMKWDGPMGLVILSF
jgi:predicted aspartyl protease